MNQGRYQLIALDIDGTLLNSKKEITPDTEAMVHRAFQAGKQVVLSTGRSFAELEEILHCFPEMRYGICESGALTFDRSRTAPIAVHPIPLDVVCQAGRNCPPAGGAGPRLSAGPAGDQPAPDGPAGGLPHPLFPAHVPALLPSGGGRSGLLSGVVKPLHRKDQPVSPLHPGAHRHSIPPRSPALGAGGLGENFFGTLRRPGGPRAGVCGSCAPTWTSRWRPPSP